MPNYQKVYTITITITNPNLNPTTTVKDPAEFTSMGAMGISLLPILTLILLIREIRLLSKKNRKDS